MLQFGTDGVRAEALTQLTPAFVLTLGSAASRVLEGDTIIVGRDTRESGPELQRAFTEGCAREGVTVRDIGVVPTPAVAWLCAADGLPGAMLSASHNPWQDNGVKLFSAGGRKLSDADQDVIQSLLSSDGLLEHDSSAVTASESGSIDRYLDAVVASVEGRGFDGRRVVLDSANGSASATAETIFRRLGSEVISLADKPDGRNINAGVGSTHPEFLQAAVLEHGAVAGFAFDGDADRIAAVGADGVVIDGDRIIAMSAIDRRDRGALAENTVVITVMANLGFRVAMDREGIAMVETPVGDRYVLEALDSGGFSLGGEQSGHVIHRDLATTGDGVLTAVQLLDAAIRRDVDLGEWARTVMTRYPQVLENVKMAAKIPDLSGRLAEAVAVEEAALGDSGRVLIRESGTEPVVRVMVEAAEATMAAESAARLVAAVRTLA
ncbi:MAG: phosphoglucosamine mutase [Acidimicrobiia bacterium]|nr:phosphoglucosamine mutase [Acidimicrobiia bacterium]